MPFLINTFRGLEDFWNNFEDHDLCTKPKSKSESRCMFCHLRSICLRSNRVKYKRSIKPVELESQMKMLPSEDSFVKEFPSMLPNILENISSYDLEFRNSFIGGNLKCMSCSKKIPIGQFEVIHFDQLQGLSSIQDMGGKLFEEIAKMHQKMSSRCKNLKVDLKTNKLLMITMESCEELLFSKEICILGNNYEVLSFSAMDSSMNLKTTFKFKENYFTSENGSIPQLYEISGPQRISTILFVKSTNDMTIMNCDSYILKKGILDSLRRETYKILDNPKYEEIKEKRKESDRKRDQTMKRIEMHNKIDKIR